MGYNSRDSWHDQTLSAVTLDAVVNSLQITTTNLIPGFSFEQLS